MPNVARAPEKEWFGHPRGLATLFFTEMWERFSYYGMRALLVLYMTAPVASGGLGFDIPKATGVYGWYTALVYLSALPGGAAADRWLGQKLAVVIGERGQLQTELANLKREAESSWAAERVENALLRERINDVAAEVARLTAVLENRADHPGRSFPGPQRPLDLGSPSWRCLSRLKAASGKKAGLFASAFQRVEEGVAGRFADLSDLPAGWSLGLS